MFGLDGERHTFQIPAGYYPSPKRILKAIEGKKHRTPLKKKFDIGMNEIDHKIGIAMKKDCQVSREMRQRVFWEVIHGTVRPSSCKC
jgi:hypothetical protein